MAETWAPGSWVTHPARQQPEWPDAVTLEEVLGELRTLPPLVFAGEARALQAGLAKVARGEAFVLQAGDCAEAFGDFTADSIRDKLKVILQMAVVLTYSSGLPVIKVGRIAGQFAKPRTKLVEMVDGLEVPTFRGHAVNSEVADPVARIPDPRRLLRAYNQSAATLNLIRAFTKGGFADIRQIHTWNQEFVARSSEGQRYEAIAGQIERALLFMAACGVDLTNDPTMHEVDLFTSHEALLLGYEEALTREDSLTGNWYDCSAHLLWVGERTRQPDSAHVEFLSGVKNPVAAKIGPSAAESEVLELCERLNPDREPGRLTLISRLGANHARDLLPALVRAVKGAGHEVVWICDPMHGNTEIVGGHKVRRFEAILEEIKTFFDVHHKEGTIPGGVHLELTADNVTECIGGTEGTEMVPEQDPLCDPRLNARQSLDLAFQVGEMLQRS